ncbi:hypothetical protein N657DRAFT_244275 [Parathielavia appendiculata]|uniref:DNA/RNA-binding domain-containing protein n=1 Tax=Parathielavia appendiculata TaxID=2587402 RepID=A0AAN6TSJ4_9PEZI|nr:hypothetical protein N657DRAFT_244275 [Parathielavia appendiculata]
MDDFSKRWNNHLRRSSRKTPDIWYPLCDQDACEDYQHPRDDNAEPGCPKENHITDSHTQLIDHYGTVERTAWVQPQRPAAESSGDSPETSARPARPILNDRDRRSKRASPTRSVKTVRFRSVSPPKPAKVRHATLRGVASRVGRLWSPHDNNAATAPRTSKATYWRESSSGLVSKPCHQPRSSPPPRLRRATPAAIPPVDDDSTDIIKQPETHPISQEQLVAEVKGIYAGLVMVESKCIEIQIQQSSQTDPANKLNNDQWQALTALHRTLIHEHHDFFLASQHPSASPALRRLAAKYAMPARLWRHGIHSYLELLRHRLPASLDHMLTFIYMAYSMMALLYETVPTFEDTWIECLGDLGRYRMAIEDDDIRDREVWTAVSRHWYSRASDTAPITGRFYHHLAILARPNALQQLYYYSKSLCVEMPFPSARESIMTLFEPIMSRTPNHQQARLPPTELNFVKTHGIMFSGKQMEELESAMGALFHSLDNHIGRSTRRWLESGYHMAISNICALTGYGDQTNLIAAALKAFSRTNLKPAGSQDQPMREATASETPSVNAKLATSNSTNQLPNALRLLTGTYDVVCRRFGDPNILPFLHVTLVFVHHLTFCPDAMAYLAPHFPWKLTALMLNTLLKGSSSSSPNASQGSGLARLLESDQFPGAVKEGKDVKEGVEGAGRRRRPLPDDFAIRGFSWAEKYLPDGWFVTEEKIDDDEKYFELASMTEERSERVVWLGCRIAKREGGRWLKLDNKEKRFGVSHEYEVKLDLEVPGQNPIIPGETVDYGELHDAGTVA